MGDGEGVGDGGGEGDVPGASDADGVGDGVGDAADAVGVGQGDAAVPGAADGPERARIAPVASAISARGIARPEVTRDPARGVRCGERSVVTV